MMQPKVFIFILAGALVTMGVIVSTVSQYYLIGMILFLMGGITFILPSMRRPRK